MIVTSYESADALRTCLSALSPQAEWDEIVVSDCSRADPARELAERFPEVKVLHLDEPVTVPQLRWRALAETSGEVVAVLESQAIPAGDWCARTLQAHEASPAAPACAGEVTHREGSSPLGLGVYLCEYAAFAPPVESADTVSGLNCSFKRDQLERCADLLDAGVWESELCELWRREGKPLAPSQARVVFNNTLDWKTAIAQRYHYGRDYAAGRGLGAGRRTMYAVGSVVLPLLLTCRNLLAARRKGLLWRLAAGLGWALTLNAAWAVGEFMGYTLSRASRQRSF